LQRVARWRSIHGAYWGDPAIKVHAANNVKERG
jgi:hypothetical protein